MQKRCICLTSSPDKLLFKLLVNWIEIMRPITFEGPCLLAFTLPDLYTSAGLSIPRYLMEKHLPDTRNYYLGAKELLVLRIYFIGCKL